MESIDVVHDEGFPPPRRRRRSRRFFDLAVRRSGGRGFFREPGAYVLGGEGAPSQLEGRVIPGYVRYYPAGGGGGDGEEDVATFFAPKNVIVRELIIRGEDGGRSTLLFRQRARVVSFPPGSRRNKRISTSLPPLLSPRLRIDVGCDFHDLLPRRPSGGCGVVVVVVAGGRR